MIKLKKGDRFGSLTILAPAPPSSKYPNKRMWRCKCDCGSEIDYPASYIVHGAVTSCGCGNHKPRKDISGRRNGMLVAIEPTGEIRNHSSVWRFKCDCGNEIEATEEAVLWGGKISCGCMKSEQFKKFWKKGQDSTIREYGTNINLIRSKKVYQNSESGIRGVTMNKRTGRWVARIGFQGRIYNIGTFSTQEAAAAARRLAEDQIHGEFLRWYDEMKEKENEDEKS